MKNTAILLMLISFLFSFNSYSQNIENKKKETIEKKVTVKDTNVETIVEKEVDEEVNVVEVEGTNKTNQASEEKTKKDQKIKVVEVVEKGKNEENQKQLEKMKKEEAERIDGQQRGVPVQTKKDTTTVVMQKEKAQKGGEK